MIEICSADRESYGGPDYLASLLSVWIGTLSVNNSKLQQLVIFLVVSVCHREFR